MTLATLKYFGQRAWLWIKTHWKIVVGFLIAVIAYTLILKKGDRGRFVDDLIDMTKKLTADHAAEVKILSDSYKAEAVAKQTAVEKAKEDLKSVDKEYDEKNRNLEEKVEKEKKIAKESDLSKLAKDVADLTGYKLQNKDEV